MHGGMPASVTPLVHAVPWLMLATVMRIIYAAHTGLLWHVTFFVANICIFLAFMIVSHVMIQHAGGRTELGSLPFGKQVAIGRNVVPRITLLLTGLSFAVGWFGAPTLADHLLFGFDGIAFDQYSGWGFLLSSFLAALILLMLLAGERGERGTISAAVAEFAARRKSLVPAVLAVAAFLLGLSAFQGVVRELVYEFGQMTSVPFAIRSFVFFIFIFSFATVRLCGCLALLVFALRRSYRRGDQLPTGTAVITRPE